MIDRSEILKGKDCPPELESNLLELLIRINKVRDAWGRPMVVTSGYRSMEDQLEIYKGRVAPVHSKHLTCQAIDIHDPNQELQKWIMNNIDLMEQIGLYFESFSYTSTWVHFQIVPPKSGKMFFIPY